MIMGNSINFEDREYSGTMFKKCLFDTCDYYLPHILNNPSDIIRKQEFKSMFLLGVHKRFKFL